MEENLIEKWINSDKNLYDLIVEIQSTNKSINEQAELAFEKLSKLYGIPRMPSDISDDESKQRSFFEELALIKYLAEENEDPRGMVLSAAFNLLNNCHVELFQIAEKEFGDSIPKKFKIGITGEGFNGKVVFPQKESKSWFELGCKIMNQIN